MKKINKKIKFSELVEKFPQAVEMLAEKGMHCFGCPMAIQETLEQGCLAHGLDADKVVEELNKKVGKKKVKKLK